jgi:hypothetical protein
MWNKKVPTNTGPQKLHKTVVDKGREGHDCTALVLFVRNISLRG